jgi:hypothetical protein
MPGISPIPILGHALMMVSGLKLPTDDSSFDPPDRDHYGDSMDPPDKIAIPTEIPWMFMPTDMQSYHQDSSDKISKNFKDFHDKALDAVKFSLDMWKLQAKVQDLKVMAVSAIGAPGCLDGPELESNIKNFPGWAAETENNYTKYKEAVAEGVSKNFKDWQDKVMVPGLPAYPAFAAWPGPMAPPMPCVPLPLVACPSANMAKITVPAQLKSAMVDALDSSMKDEDPDKQHEKLFESVGTVLSLAFLLWILSQQLMLVLGKGPVPSFAPPYVPVGPVLGGDNIAAPGHLIA